MEGGRVVFVARDRRSQRAVASLRRGWRWNMTAGRRLEQTDGETGGRDEEGVQDGAEEAALQGERTY